MTKTRLLAGCALCVFLDTPALAQAVAATGSQDNVTVDGSGQEVPANIATPSDVAPQAGDIVVTAQRQSQRLQDVPIAVSAFTAENLERQQIVNPAALQQSLPNVTFTKTNFTSSSFTIRGIGDLCVGATLRQCHCNACQRHAVGNDKIVRVGILRSSTRRGSARSTRHVVWSQRDLGCGQFHYG